MYNQYFQRVPVGAWVSQEASATGRRETDTMNQSLRPLLHVVIASARAVNKRRVRGSEQWGTEERSKPLKRLLF